MCNVLIFKHSDLYSSFKVSPPGIFGNNNGKNKYGNMFKPNFPEVKGKQLTSTHEQMNFQIISDEKYSVFLKDTKI